MSISELRNRLCYVKHGGVPLPRSSVHPGTWGGAASGGVRGDLRITVRASPSGATHPSSTLQPVELPKERAGPSAGRGCTTRFLRCPLWRPDVVALSEPDPEMTAMLSQAAENVRLVWNPPPRPDPSRLDEWFLGGGRAGSQRPPLMPFLPEVHEELTRSWKAPFTARNKSCGSSALTTLDGGSRFGVHGHPLSGAVCGHEWMNEWCIYIALSCVLLYTQSALQSCGGVSPQPPPVCSIHLDDATAATGQRRQCAHHTPATGGEERERANQEDGDY